MTPVFLTADGVPRMTIVRRPSVGASMLGGSITVPPTPCTHAPARPVHPWTGEDATAGTVAVVGAGQDGPAARRPVRRTTAGP